MLRANYFVRNFVYLGQNELRSIVKRKTKEDRAQPSDLKSIAFQYVSQAMFTITYGNMLRIFSIQDKSNFSKFFLREDKEFAFEVKDSVNAIATHPYLPFTFALAFE